MAWKLSGSGKADAKLGEWTGFLDTGVKVEGTIDVEGTFRFDATMKGTIISRDVLLVGESAKIEGQIEGNQVVVAGRFDGVIFAKGRVEIQPKGVVTGEIHTPTLSIEPGGVFDGRCHMLTSKEATAPLTIPVRSAAQQQG